MIKIEMVDPIECRISIKQAKKIAPCITFTAHYWRQGPHHKERFEYPKDMFSKKLKGYNYFYAGMLDRILKYCKEEGIEIDLKKEDWYIKPQNTPNLPGITFRPDQLEMINKAIEIQRGIIKAPTGSGKTIVMMGILSCFKETPLILAHTKDIVVQTIDELKKFGWKNIQQIGGGKKFAGNFFGDVVVSTMQSFKKIDPSYYCDKFPIVMVDEGHHITKLEGTYGEILGNLLSPIRLAFTATLHKETEAQMALEGLMGPIIKEMTINEASELDILAVPKVKITAVPFDYRIRETRNYGDVTEKDDDGHITDFRKGVYTVGVVENEYRNNSIVADALAATDKGEVSLIFVTRQAHGKILSKLFQKEGLRVPFIFGGTKDVERKNVKNSMIKGRRKIVIASVVWKEGINIPSINNVFLAGNEKSILKLLQDIGRGLRRTDNKRMVTIYDYFDSSSPHLISHFGERVSLYCEMGWL